MTTPLSNRHPVLLGPVRLETRFTATELLIRIYPDEWAVDKFEPKVSPAELDALDAYWTALWRAGSSTVAQQAAWRELAGRIPPGRATWLLTERKPANETERPSTAPAGAVVLPVVTSTPVPAADRQPTITYWTAIWQAHGDREKLRAADRALITAVGSPRAATIRSRRPSGVDGAELSPNNTVVVAFLVLAPHPPEKIAAKSWTTPATARLLPDRFTVLALDGDSQIFELTTNPVLGPFAVSPDPTAQDKPKINEDTGALHVPEALKWLTNFEEAHRRGLGVRIGRTTRIDAGIPTLLVYGLRENPDAAATAAALTQQLQRQLRSTSGLSLLAQGTPTNNSEQLPAGPGDQAEAARRAASASFAAADWKSTKDGPQLAGLLGLDLTQLPGLPGADGTDQAEAKAANIALWPATWGSFLRHTLHPLLDDEAVARTREFFVRNVSGRGPLPVLKIGRQPYGIVPTTDFRALSWPAANTHRHALKKVLDTAAADWDRVAAEKVQYLHKPGGDPHQKLLDILALHPGSAEYHQRYAQSVEDLFNRANLGAAGAGILDALRRLQLAPPIQALLTKLGATNPDPDLLRRLFVDSQHPLLAPLVDDRPLSEEDPIRPYDLKGRNYLGWLAANAKADLTAIRNETGFAGTAPAALLYYLARHAVLLGFADAARRLAIRAGVADPTDLADRDPLFVHVKHFSTGTGVLDSESRYRRLYSSDPLITGSTEVTVAKHIGTVLATNPDTAALKEQLDAVEVLAATPTARLERVLAEHLDLATYRLDAWRLGLATERLTELRAQPGAAQGIHLGAYGWLENVKPDLSPTDNGGYIHTPSPAQARTAAVLRSGYLANRTTERGEFAVNLSSDRVRVALELLDGLRQGQSLSALLGYRFERGLHEGHPERELDKYLAPLRAAFPLRFGKLDQPAAGAPPEFAEHEARVVIDGLELHRTVTRATDPAHRVYPFGKKGLPPNPPNDDLIAIHAEVENLRNLHDALADLAVAEGTHQALLGNHERAAATLDSYAKAGFPPEPAIVETPRSGTTLTHRFALHLRPNLSPGLSATPRAQAEPAVNDWLPQLLPLPDKLVAQVTWFDPIRKRNDGRAVSMSDLGLQPIDLLWTVRPVGETATRSDLEDRILGAVFKADTPRPDVRPKIEFTTRVAGRVTFFELSPLINALRTLLTTARPVRPTDLVPGAGVATVDRTADAAINVPRERPAAVRKALGTLLTSTTTYGTDLGALYPPAGPRTADLLKNIDTFLIRYADLIGTAGRFGLVRSGWGELTLWRGTLFAELLAALDGTAKRLDPVLKEADVLIAKYDGLPATATDEERYRLLEQAERLLSTTVTSPRPDRPRTLRTTVGTRRNTFKSTMDAIARTANTTKVTLSGLFAEIAALPPLAAIDPVGLDLTPFQLRVVEFGRDLLARAAQLKKDIEARNTLADKALLAYDAAIPGPDRVTAAIDALKAMLGEDVLVVPEFTPSEDLVDQWRDAHFDSGELLEHLAARKFPLDDWLHGVARVREQPRRWEKAVALGDVLFSGPGLLGIPSWREPALTPIQLPYRENDSWLGLEFKKDSAGKPVAITEDKVLYTAHYATGALLGQTRAGLLLDEWTEVIPAETETTGIALHYDGPDSEPPQAMLLVAPPVVTDPPQNWQRAHLVNAIRDTFAMARSRAVEPAQLDDTAYAQLLPATVMSATRQQITISTDLALANLRWKADHD
ncbi:hypothetical protein [Crossiella cryophila]|uniref:Uncharacterized protein n=1 Tax=Crossiella cryophila TaxID=43355 RepID=A0A7W7FWG4_9PSEU|nr:hypothetical protein [Crossiella cryophila]MBB4679583.1 hypothetical protein [Crossiella cryophila]